MNRATGVTSTPRRLAPRLVVSAVILAAIAVVLWRSARPEPVAVLLGDVDRGRVVRSVANTRAGTVNACRRAKLAPPAGGQIVALPVREGDRVRAGQVLLELWSDDVVAQARVAREQAESASLRAHEACLSADVAGREAERARRLFDSGLLPEEQFDRAASTAKTARAACDAASAEVARTEALIQVANANRTRTVLRAPFDGVVANVSGEMGEFTTPSPPGIPTPPAIDLIDDTCLYVTAPVDEIDVASVAVGQPAIVSIDALPGRKFEGRVRRIAPFVLDLEKQARTVDVEIELAANDDTSALIVGYSADVEIILDVRDDVVRVPTQALMEGSRALVFPASGGALEERRLETGVANWEYTEVRSGLTAGEKVVTSVEREGVVSGARAVAENPGRQ